MQVPLEKIMSSLFQNEIKDKFKTGLAYVRGPEKSGSSAQNAGSEGGKNAPGESEDCPAMSV